MVVVKSFRRQALPPWAGGPPGELPTQVEGATWGWLGALPPIKFGRWPSLVGNLVCVRLSVCLSVLTCVSLCVYVSVGR